jgi:hypothetical protein
MWWRAWMFDTGMWLRILMLPRRWYALGIDLVTEKLYHLCNAMKIN